MLNYITLLRKRFMKKFCILLLCFPVLFGCKKGPTQPEFSEQLKATTDKTYYILKEQIILTIENRTDSILLLGHCNYYLTFYYEKKSSNEWNEISGRGIPCLTIWPMGEIRVEPKSIFKDTLLYSLPGTYRLKIPFGFNGDQSFLKNLFSNEFIIQ